MKRNIDINFLSGVRSEKAFYTSVLFEFGALFWYRPFSGHRVIPAPPFKETAGSIDSVVNNRTSIKETS